MPTALPGAEPGNRLVVLDGRGRILTMRPDGSEAVALTDPAGEGRVFLQPTWSPDGRRVVWTELDASGEGPSSALATSGFDGVGRTRTATSVAAFYLAWDPTSSRVAYLGTRGPDQGIELGMVEADDGEALPLDSGEPFYFWWAPEGDRMLVHVGEDRLEELRLDGGQRVVDELPGTFQAPVWADDGRRLIFVSRDQTGQRLVVAGGGDRRRELLRFGDGGIMFVLSPDGRRVAYQVIGDPGPADRVLSVVDVRTGERLPLSPVPSVAFFWSPAGDRLLFLRPTLVDDELWFRWIVWDAGDFFQTERFRPSTTLGRDYLPFFSQYAQNISLWAPDGSAFAYAGTNEAGESGIWVQEARPDTPPSLVSDGVFVAWSPT